MMNKEDRLGEFDGHTQGPWEYDGDGMIIVEIGDCPNVPIVEDVWIGRDREDECHINGRLLAAAPELLDRAEKAEARAEAAEAKVTELSKLDAQRRIKGLEGVIVRFGNLVFDHNEPMLAGCFSKRQQDKWGRLRKQILREMKRAKDRGEKIALLAAEETANWR